MGVSPLRALTHTLFTHFKRSDNSRNGSKPVEGIDTFNIVLSFFCFNCRNESKPVEGIDTSVILLLMNSLIIM